MEWKDVGSIIGKAAPILAGIFSGGTATAIAAAGSLLASALGTEATPDAIHKAIAADPQAALTLAKIEADNRVALGGLAVELARVELADVANARARDVDLVKAGDTSSGRTKRWMIAGDFFVLAACLLFLWAMPGANEAIRTLVGTIAAGAILCLRDAHQFEFGSSRSSQNKDATIAAERAAKA